MTAEIKAALLSEYTFKTELHAHTLPVSTCSDFSAEELMERYSRLGVDSIVLTNHFTSSFVNKNPDAAERYAAAYSEFRASAEKYGIIPIFGMEIRFKGVSNDYLLYGITSDDLPRLCELVEGSVEAFSEVFRRRGVLFFQAHPKRDGMVEIDPRYLDGVESFNTHLGHNSRIGQAAAFANASGLIAIGGSDFHHEGHQGTCLLRTKERIDSEQTLVRVLSSRDYLLDIGGSIVLP